MKTSFTCLFVLVILSSRAQQPYRDSIQRYIDQYVQKHEVVAAADKKFLRFFPVDESFRIKAKLNRTPNSKWFTMETSGAVRKTFRTYGILEFYVHDTLVRLPIYQSQGLITSEKYKDLLFLPFTDLTSGGSTYPAGRYIDLYTTEIKNDSLIIDFNKAYNPYCAYVTGKYNCPVPPKENQLAVAINAGEQNFAKPHD